jgi:hypothetical protein
MHVPGGCLLCVPCDPCGELSLKRKSTAKSAKISKKIRLFPFSQGDSGPLLGWEVPMPELSCPSYWVHLSAFETPPFQPLRLDKNF